MKRILVLDNIRSAYNVGSIFRTADGAGSCEIYICGISPTPEHIKVRKTSLGADENISWRYFKTTNEAINELRRNKIPIYSIELSKGAKEYSKIIYPKDVALVFGHEKDGVSKHILEISDRIIYIPMRGVKTSLNVASAAAIVIYESTKNAKD